ncbi:hypothetical protein BDV98DRAFT_609006 [Pterulicium gracile]|uniref:Mid2 domain-containing protein n=1 Tax=Pterulicium gracile TaxID=1884261 RepID=A0A5C3Q532_9AGAR|nr:hypothetical protein BDV98DRAFT_609006 [Pterula gracilis]
MAPRSLLAVLCCYLGLSLSLQSAVAQIDPYFTNTLPATVDPCESLSLTWEDGSPPYYIELWRSREGSRNGVYVKTLTSNIEGNSFESVVETRFAGEILFFELYSSTGDSTPGDEFRVTKNLNRCFSSSSSSTAEQTSTPSDSSSSEPPPLPSPSTVNQGDAADDDDEALTGSTTSAKKFSNAGLIAGIVVAVVAAIAGIGFGLFFYRRKKQMTGKEWTEGEIDSRLTPSVQCQSESLIVNQPNSVLGSESEYRGVGNWQRREVAERYSQLSMGPPSYCSSSSKG